MPPFGPIGKGDIIIPIVRDFRERTGALLPVHGLTHELIRCIGVLQLTVAASPEWRRSVQLGIGPTAMVLDAGGNGVHQVVQHIDLCGPRVKLFVAIAYGTGTQSLITSHIFEWKFGSTSHHLHILPIITEAF